MDGNFSNNQNNNSNYQDHTANVQNQVPPVNNYGGSNGSPEPKKTNVLAIVGMILGILSILMNCTLAYAFVGIVFGIAGLVCSIISRKQGPSGMAVAGIVCSIIGMLIAVVITILMVIGFAALQDPEMQNLINSLEY